MRATQLTDPLCYHAEGPVWSASWGGLRWVDLLAGDVMSLGADGQVHRTHVGDVVAALRPRVDGGAVLALARGVALEDPDGTVRPLVGLWDDPGVRANEGACDPQGRFYLGSMAYDQTEGAARVYRVDADGSAEVVIDAVTVSNGMDWSPDGSLVYYNDTPTGRVDVFDYDPGAGLTGRRTFTEIPGGGRPDGLTVDAEGGVWTAVIDQAVVQRYTPEGRLDAVIEVPVQQVTACTFGGDGLDRLFITTSQENLEPGEDPLAGALFVADVGVRGQQVRAFAG